MRASNYPAAVRPIKVVAMGGGTGLSTLLHGLKQHVVLAGEAAFDRTLPFISELSAIVTVSDDGGSSGTTSQRTERSSTGGHQELHCRPV